MKTTKSVVISLAMSLFLINIAMANHCVPVPTSERILNREGRVLIEEKVSTSRLLVGASSLDSLPIGSHPLTIKSSQEEILPPSMVTTKELIMDETERAVYFPANFSQKRRNLKLSLLNPANSVVRVFIIDQTGKVRYQDSITDQTVVEKDFNLRQLPAGNYTVIVDNASEVYTKNLSLR